MLLRASTLRDESYRDIRGNVGRRSPRLCEFSASPTRNSRLPLDPSRISPPRVASSRRRATRPSENGHTGVVRRRRRRRGGRASQFSRFSDGNVDARRAPRRPRRRFATATRHFARLFIQDIATERTGQGARRVARRVSRVARRSDSHLRNSLALRAGPPLSPWNIPPRKYPRRGCTWSLIPRTRVRGRKVVEGKKKYSHGVTDESTSVRKSERVRGDGRGGVGGRSISNVDHAVRERALPHRCRGMILSLASRLRAPRPTV